MIYLIGSLRNPKVAEVAQGLRMEGYDVFDDWHAAGPDADDQWKKYEQARGRDFQDALELGEAAAHVFSFDKEHLDAADVAVMVLPAGRSCHMELGYMAGSGKKTYILLDDDEDRWDVMYLFADGVFYTLEALMQRLETDGVER